MAESLSRQLHWAPEILIWFHLRQAKTKQSAGAAMKNATKRSDLICIRVASKTAPKLGGAVRRRLGKASGLKA